MLKSVDGSVISAFGIHECEGSSRMGSRPRRYIFTGHCNGTIQVRIMNNQIGVEIFFWYLYHDLKSLISHHTFSFEYNNLINFSDLGFIDRPGFGFEGHRYNLFCVHNVFPFGAIYVINFS